jgi:hypothetical protein
MIHGKLERSCCRCTDVSDSMIDMGHDVEDEDEEVTNDDL